MQCEISTSSSRGLATNTLNVRIYFSFTYRKMSYAKALKKTGSQSVEATIRQRRLLFAGALARQDDKRLPKRLLFAERLEGG